MKGSKFPFIQINVSRETLKGRYDIMKKELEIILNDMDNELEYLMNAYDEAVNGRNKEDESYYSGKYNILKGYYERLLKVIENDN